MIPEFAVSKNESEGLWDIRDKDTLTLLATVEGFNMKNARFEGRRMIGRVKSVFGVRFIDTKFLSDNDAVRMLGTNTRFDLREGEPIKIDYDGVYPYGDHSRGRLENSDFVCGLFDSLWRREHGCKAERI